MQKLFENWRHYINEALLVESRKSDAKEAIIKNLDKIDWIPQEPGYPDFTQAFFDSLQSWVGGLNSSKHLVGFVVLVNAYIYERLINSEQLYGGIQWNRFKNVLKKAEEAYELYKEATDKRMKISAGDFFGLGGVARKTPAKYSAHASEHMRHQLANIFEHLQPLAANHAGDNVKGPIEPITKFSAARGWDGRSRDRGYGTHPIEGSLSVLDIFIYFAEILGETIRERGYRKDPAVIKKAEETIDLIINNEYYSISQIQSMQAGCIMGCSIWCISQVPSREQEADPTLDDPHANRFNYYTSRGDKIYILDFKHLGKTKHPYKKVSLQFNIDRFDRSRGPYEVIDCATNRNDYQRQASAVKVGVKYNLLAYGAGGSNYQPNFQSMMFDFEDFLKQVSGQQPVKTYGFYEKEEYFTNIAKRLNIDLRPMRSTPSWRSPWGQWERMVQESVTNINSLSTTHFRSRSAVDNPVGEAMIMLFDHRLEPFTGLWKSIADEVQQGRQQGEIWNEIKKVLENNPEVFEQVQERLQQEAGGPNVGAARNLVWDAVRRLTPSPEWMWEIYLKHWDPRGLREDPEEWFEQHVGDLAEEIINVMININPAALMGYLGVDTDVSKWLADGNNRDWLAAELRRMLEENMDTAIKLAEALASENPQMAIEKTWELFYKSLGKEVGHLIDRAFGSDEDRALELARDLQENRKKTSKILISIKRPAI